MIWSINQSIDQLTFISANLPSKSRLTGMMAKSVLNSKIDEAFCNIGRAGVYRGKAKSKRCVLRCFLKVATERAERTYSGRLFQKEGAQEWNTLVPVLVLRDRQTNFCLVSVNGMEVIPQAWTEDKPAVFHESLCKSTNWSWTIF